MSGLEESTPILPARAKDGRLSTKEMEDAGLLGYMARPGVAGMHWLFDLRRNFGTPLLAILFFSQHVTKGFVRDFAGAGTQYIMEEYKVPAAKMGIYGGVMGLPWALKPVIGVLSDYCPLFGYAKAPYIIMASIIGTIACVLMGFFRYTLDINQVVFLGFCVSLYVSTVDLLTEASYAKALREKPAQGPALISYVWGGMTVAGVFATIFSGYVLTHATPWTLYTIAAIPASFIIFPAMMNWLNEPKLKDEEVQEQRASIRSQSEALILCGIMLASTFLLSWSGMHLEAKEGAMVSLGVMLVVLFSFSVMLNPVIAKVNAFGLIQTSLAISLGGAGFYFAMDTPKQYPEGPHFSVQFYSVVLPLTGSVFTIIGIWLYNKSAGNMTYQRMYIVGNLIYCVCSLADVAFYLRWNVAWGINDHFFVLGSSSIQTVLGTWLWMPSTVIMSQLCPKGMEAIMYALLAGCHNLGMTISSNFGALMLEWYNIAPDGSDAESKQFDNLWYCTLISCMLPTLSIIMVPWFIPDKMQTTRILDRDDMPANHDSYYRRWCGYNDNEDLVNGNNENHQA